MIILEQFNQYILYFGGKDHGNSLITKVSDHRPEKEVLGGVAEVEEDGMVPAWERVGRWEVPACAGMTEKGVW